MEDWSRVGKYVVARRVELGFKQRTDFADALQVSARLLSDLENGRRSNFDSVTIASLENVLGWETGSVRSIATGGEPTVRRAVGDQPARARRAPDATHDEIDMIYASQTMSAEQKLRAIRQVLLLRAEVDAQRTATAASAETSDEQDSSSPSR